MGTVWAVVPAAGSGERFAMSSASAAQQDKLLAELSGCPVLVLTVEALLSCSEISGVIIATNPGKLAKYAEVLSTYSVELMDKIRIVAGGKNRRESVYRGLEALPADCDRVVVHDAARPMVTVDMVESGLQALAEGSKGAITAIPVYDTVKRSTDSLNISETLPRQTLWRAQTPQFFWTETLLQAHKAVATEAEITDDAQLLELADLGPVKLIEGSERNLKITTANDLALAQFFHIPQPVNS